MPQIHELSSASTITSGNTLAMDTGTVTQKIDYNVLAKCIIEQYASSSLGGSAQSVKTALDAVISKQWTVFSNTSTLTSQADALANNSVYFGYCDAYGHVSDTDVPVNSNYYIQVDRRNASYITMFIVSVSNPANHQYVRVKNNGTWGEWVKQPTRAEMDSATNHTKWRTYGAYTSKADLLSAIDADITAAGQGAINGYLVPANSKLLGAESHPSYFVAYSNSTNYRCMILYHIDSGAPMYIIHKVDGTWGDTVRMPTRTEIDSINAKRFVKNLSTGDNSFTLSNSFRGVLYTLDTVPASLTSAIIYSTSAGTFGRKQILSGDNITLSSTGANNLTVNVASGFPTLYVDVVSGTIS